MNLHPSPEDERFRVEVRAWLAEHLVGEYAELDGAGGPGREHEAIEARRAWERELGRGGWIGLGWPESVGGRGATLMQQVAFHEEYATAGAPGRMGYIGEQLLGPTLIAFGTDAQRERFLPGILRGEELWCQGYSEPDAGSDLAGVRTRAEVRDGEWLVNGQKVWTSLAEEADWCFAIVRSERGSERRRGLSYLLVPMRQPGIQIRPIIQLTGTSEFSEVFFDDARTAAENVVGAPGDGWKVAMGTLGFERGVATLGQQIGFGRELERVVERAQATGAIEEPALRDRLVDAWVELRAMRCNALRTLGASAGESAAAASISKLLWGNWHRRLGELGVDVEGPAATLLEAGPYELDSAQALYLFSRADTIYAGSDEIQRNIIAERVLGLPRDRS
jgi:alkylation response protein AidB-like acyl-CoA dehydrogenase